MPATTRSQSNLQANQTPINQASPHGSNSSIPGAFNQDELADPDTTVLFKPPTDFIFSGINELTLDSTLDLAKHPAGEILNILATYSFASVNEFFRAVATNGAKILHSLSKIIAYNVATNEKIIEQYVEWKKVTRVESRKKLQFRKDLEDLQQELNNSQREFSAILEERDWL